MVNSVVHEFCRWAVQIIDEQVERVCREPRGRGRDRLGNLPINSLAVGYALGLISTLFETREILVTPTILATSTEHLGNSPILRGLWK